MAALFAIAAILAEKTRIGAQLLEQLSRFLAPSLCKRKLFRMRPPATTSFSNICACIDSAVLFKADLGGCSLKQPVGMAFCSLHRDGRG